MSCTFLTPYWKKFKAACGLFSEMNETSFKIFFWINETKIYTTTWRSRCCQLHSLALLNTSAGKYISWRQFCNICLTVVIFWICLRLRNTEIKYLRKVGICIPNCTAKDWTYSALQYLERYFFDLLLLLN